jgi:hypothetical protein
VNKHIFAFILPLFLCGCDIRTRVEDLTTDQVSDLSLAQGEPQQGQIERVGAARAEFIPNKPTALSGFGGAARRFLPPIFLGGGQVAFCKPYEKVIHPPQIKTAVIEFRNESAAAPQKLFLVSLDLVAVTSDMTKKIHNAINQVTGENTSNLNNTLVLATHTHSGPAGLSENPLWSTFVCDRYNPELTSAYLDLFKATVKKALAQLQPITSVGKRTAQVPGLLNSRFEGMLPDTEASLLTFQTANESLPLALLRMAVHPTTYGPSDLVLTADLVAPVEQTLKQRFNAEEVILLQTEIGNMTANTGSQSIEAWAQSVTASLQSAQISTEPSKPRISTSTTIVELPSPGINWKGCGAEKADALVSLGILENLPKRSALTFWKINEEINLFLPGEWTTSGAKEIKDSLRKRMAANETLKLYSLAHDYTGYHLSRADYQSKALESCSSLYGESSSEVFRDSLLQAQMPL